MYIWLAAKFSILDYFKLDFLMGEILFNISTEDFSGERQCAEYCQL